MSAQGQHATRDKADDYLISQISRLDGEIEAMRHANSQAIASAVEHGIMRAVSNPELWAAASSAIQQQAKARAGGLLFHGIGAVFSRLGWLIIAGVAIYTLGGWTALAGAVKAWLAGGGQA